MLYAGATGQQRSWHSEKALCRPIAGGAKVSLEARWPVRRALALLRATKHVVESDMAVPADQSLPQHDLPPMVISQSKQRAPS
jgi:hypothetical protein